MIRSIRITSVAIALLICSSRLAAQPKPFIHPDGTTHWYDLVNVELNWDAAKADAESRTLNGMTGYLATLTSQAENDFVATQLLAGFDAAVVTIGGFQPDGSPEPAGGWQWVTGEPWSFTNWRPGEPNNSGNENAAQIYAGALPSLLGLWNDYPSDQTQGYLIEYSTPPASFSHPDGTTHYYALIDFAGHTWDEANDRARSLLYQGLPGHLATLTSAAENAVVSNLLSSRGTSPTYWLGGFQDPAGPEPDGGWHWTTGEPWLFTNWNGGEPSGGGENNLEIYSYSGAFLGKWNDADGSATAEWRGNFVAEFEPASVLVSAGSRKSHGAAGPFDIDLPLTGTPAIECRQGGPSLIILNFSEPIQAADGTPDGSEVSLSAGTLGTVSILGQQMTVNLSGVLDQTCLVLQLSGIADLSGKPLAGIAEVSVRALAGDINATSTVNILDLQAAKNQLNQPLTATNFRADVNLTGGVNILDLQAVKNDLSHAAGACP